MKDQSKEEYAIVLDFLPNGYPFDKRPSHMKTPIAQAIGKEHLILLEIVPKKGSFLQPNEEVYMGEGKREKVHHIIGRILSSKLTETAKSSLSFVIFRNPALEYVVSHWLNFLAYIFILVNLIIINKGNFCGIRVRD